jgi:hypothetical protein
MRCIMQATISTVLPFVYTGDIASQKSVQGLFPQKE